MTGPIWSELVVTALRRAGPQCLHPGSGGVGKTFWPPPSATSPVVGAISVHFERADRLHKRLKAARLDASYEPGDATSSSASTCW